MLCPLRWECRASQPNTVYNSSYPAIRRACSLCLAFQRMVGHVRACAAGVVASCSLCTSAHGLLSRVCSVLTLVLSLTRSRRERVRVRTALPRGEWPDFAGHNCLSRGTPGCALLAACIQCCSCNAGFWYGCCLQSQCNAWDVEAVYMVVIYLDALSWRYWLACVPLLSNAAARLCTAL